MTISQLVRNKTLDEFDDNNINNIRITGYTDRNNLSGPQPTYFNNYFSCPSNGFWMIQPILQNISIQLL